MKECTFTDVSGDTNKYEKSFSSRNASPNYREYNSEIDLASPVIFIRIFHDFGIKISPGKKIHSNFRRPINARERKKEEKRIVIFLKAIISNRIKIDERDMSRGER